MGQNRWNVAKAERKKQILESAARLFSARRFDEVLMDDIAQEAGVAKGTLYGHFPNKEGLYFAVVFEGLSAYRFMVVGDISDLFGHISKFLIFLGQGVCNHVICRNPMDS